jgi:hypothetical protein
MFSSEVLNNNSKHSAAHMNPCFVQLRSCEGPGCYAFAIMNLTMIDSKIIPPSSPILHTSPSITRSSSAWLWSKHPISHNYLVHLQVVDCHDICDDTVICLPRQRYLHHCTQTVLAANKKAHLFPIHKLQPLVRIEQSDMALVILLKDP